MVSSTILWLLVAVGTAIIAGLGFYLGSLLFKLKHQQQQQQRAQAEHDRKLAEHQQYLLESILVISEATIEGQCEYSEGALRIWVLLENFQPELAQACRFPALFEMYDCVKGMPTHEARKALDKKELRHLDHVRQQTEIRLAEQIKQDLRQLKTLLQPVH